MKSKKKLSKERRFKRREYIQGVPKKVPFGTKVKLNLFMSQDTTTMKMRKQNQI